MAREARRISKSGNYYIALRGQELYVTENDKERFVQIAEEKFDGGKVYGVEIGKNEIRMAVKEPSSGISMAMKSLSTVYARYFNNANGRDGKLFEGRFRSEPLETKKEVDECVANLKNAMSAPKKKAAPKTETKRAAAPKKQEKPAKKKQEAPKKDLPSWLL